MLAAANPTSKKDIKVDRNGYTEDLHEVSETYRRKHNFVCENCGVQVSELETEFMHTHHISGNKTDNREENLRCLCIKCHSEVNAHHVKNFSTAAQQMLIKLFMNNYGNKRKKSTPTL